MENSPKATIISVLVVLFLGLAGIYFVSNKGYIFDAPEPEVPLPQSPALQEQFADFLKIFLDDVEKGMKAYRDERRVLVDALRVENLREPAYVDENYALVKKIIPSLQDKMDYVASIFEAAEIRVNELLTNQPEDIRLAALQKWDELKHTQGKVYADYFTVETALLKAYEDLIEFYLVKKGQYSFNIETGEMEFKNADDAAQEKRLRQDIKVLYDMQKIVLDRAKPATSAPKK